MDRRGDAAAHPPGPASGRLGSAIFREMYRFEVRHHLRGALFWMSVVLFGLMAFGAVTSDVVQVGGAIGNVNRNAPFVVTQILTVISIVGVFLTTAFVAGAVVRDVEYRTEGILYATPVSKGAYLFGRFLGAFTISVLVYVAVAAAIGIGGLMPWLDPERVGPFMPGAFASAFGVFVLPNLLVMSAVFFGLATVTRSMMSTYVGLVAFFVAYAVAGTVLADLENETLASLLDPFGVAAFQIATKYWTTFERNTEIVGLDGPLLWNRLLWTGLGLAALAWTYLRFDFTARATRPRPSEEEAEEAAAAAIPSARGPSSGSRPGVRGGAVRAYGLGTALRQLGRQARFEVAGVVKSLPFLIIVALGVLNMVGSASVMEQFAGTPVWPVTHLVLQTVESAFLLFVVLVLTFYAGELVWRERQTGLDEVWDALPVPDWVLWGGKLAALAAVVGVVLVVGMLTGMGVQLYHGYTNLEPGLYAVGLFERVGVPFLLLAVLALAGQVVLDHKYVGYLVMVAYFLAAPVFGALDLDHNLYFYASAPATPYSDLNGYGHTLTAARWFMLYWGFAALGLTALVHLLWVRGKETRFRTRLALARQRLGPGTYAVLGVALAGFVATGSWIFYNTDVLNEYVPGDVARDRAERYERTYKKFEWAPQPRITDVYAEVDIHPERRDVEIRGTYRLVNRHEVAVDSLHLLIDPEVEIRSLEVSGAERVYRDEELGWSMWRFAEPLEPGAGMEVSFDLAVVTRGFTNEPEKLELAHNGTFFNNADYFPHVGYTRQPELGDPNERRKRGLPPVQRMPPLEDRSARMRNYISAEADWLDFETVVSTAADQVALAPGTLVEEWREGGRRYFRYRAETPILGFWAYLSGAWEVTRDRWRDVDISVYHHPDHDFNVGRMIEATKRSLEYYSREFGPYQHPYVRIVEFPRYARFAQAFPGTIPFSESIGFIARLDDPEAVDYVFYVTAHEVAHQWWAHQVIGGFQQGATVMSETLAQYSALMIMEEAYGREKMRRFLKYELDAYLRGRGGELIEEMPLLRVENQPYIHYRKGSLVMYALRDYLGEELLNRALRRYVADTRFTGPPYTTSREFLSYVTEAFPPERFSLLDDLFRRITLYELRAVDATYAPTDDGRWRVRISVEARKFRADGEGNEREVPLDLRVDVGVFGAESDDAPPEGTILFLEKRRLSANEAVIEVVVDQEPRSVGIDPFNKLIDRNPEDNLVEVERVEG